MKQILINEHLIGTKVCVVENGELVEFWVERRNQNKLVGNIYKGKVVNVLKGMQAAFVDIGLERNAFLFSGDTLVDASELADGMVEERKLKLKAGDSVLCQVVKDEFGTKGARITMNIFAGPRRRHDAKSRLRRSFKKDSMRRKEEGARRLRGVDKAERLRFYS